MAAGEAVLRRLVSSSNAHIAIVATHDSQLVTFLDDCFVPYHFGDSLNADGLHFDYCLRPGPTATRNAIALLQFHGAPEDVVRQATARVALLDAGSQANSCNIVQIPTMT